MRTLADDQHDIWVNGRYTGANRPYARATVQRTHIITESFKNGEVYASSFFGNPDVPRELDNIKSTHWERSIDADAGTMTLTLDNTKPMWLGMTPDELDEVLDQPGYYHFRRGRLDNPWNHTKNEWSNRLYPDAMLKTYEGYGIDKTQPPDLDLHMSPSGTWLIDTIAVKPDKSMTITCRDLSRLLIEQICFPPVVPTAFYPLTFESKHLEAYQQVSDSVAWGFPAYAGDSNIPYVGYDGWEHGHRGQDAFDGDPGSYFLSIGNSGPRTDYAFEWVQGQLEPDSSLRGIKVTVKGGPYLMYVSVGHDGSWYGSAVVPYNPNDPISAPNGADIPYVTSVIVPADATISIPFNPGLTADMVRVCFHDLWDSGIGPYYYRAAVREFMVSVEEVTSVTKFKTVGNITDWSDMVELVLAYAGFWWPDDVPNAYFNSGTVVRRYRGLPVDPFLGHGKLWADVEKTGYPPAKAQKGTIAFVSIAQDQFDKQPLQAVISYIRDQTGFIGYCDETGGYIFRSPNIWEQGNNLFGRDHRLVTAGSRTDEAIEIDDTLVLQDFTETLSNVNVREKYVVTDALGAVAATAAALNPLNLPPTGMRRVGIYPGNMLGPADQTAFSLKTSALQCQTMADLLSLRALFTYQTLAITIPGNPEIQIDDQVRLVERITEMGDFVYVRGITCDLDNTTGKWTYQLDTMWLGTVTETDWAFNLEGLSPVTLEQLREAGIIPEDA